MSSTRHVLCTLLVMASTAGFATAALAANAGVPSAVPDATQGVAPGASKTGPNPQAGISGTRACREAKGKSRPQLTAEQKAQRKAARQAMRAQHAAQGTTQGTGQGVMHAHKPKQARLPVC